MKAPLEWLKDFTEITGSTHEFCESMTLSGSKVEEIIVSGEDIQNVYTGKIVSSVPHPDSDHLVVVEADMGREDLGGVLQIVCGAPNVEVGMICPIAVAGATLPSGMVIKKGKLRGVESNGMCCSIQELGFSHEEFEGASENGLWHMPSSTKIGVDVREYLGLGKTTIDFEITSNRPDCFSIEGLGREAAITQGTAFKPVMPKVREEGTRFSANVAKVDILDSSLCFRYCSRVVENVTVAPSPEWMQQRLRDAGMRPINNIVDITNYVCLELGQPMHAFDLRYLAGNHIIVRRAKDQEMTRTLDGIDRILNPDMLVIADDNKVCAIAGVMGSENSLVKQDTTEILFESATFEGMSVRRTAMRNALRTEASSRYEKGLDPENAMRALERACELVEELGCGKVLKGKIDEYPTHIAIPRISFSPEKVNAFLGTQIASAFMLDTLQKLGCEIESTADGLICVPPSYRPDLICSADLAEEVARFYGYNNIKPTLMEGKETILGGRTPEQKTIEKIKDVMTSQGYFEALTYSFESPKDLDRMLLAPEDALRHQLVITNPLGEDFSVMRTSLIPSMLRIAATNGKRSVKDASIFEVAYVYLPGEDAQVLPEEIQVLSAFLFDTERSSDQADLFFRMKGHITELCSNLAIRSLVFEPITDLPYLHPGRSARITINGRAAGYFGFIHPEVAGNFECPENLVVMSIDTSALIKASTTKRIFSQLPKFPGISRDLAILVDASVSVGSLEKIIRKKGGKLLAETELFDVYTGSQVGEGKKSVAFSLLFRSPEKTLSDAEIVQPFADILCSLEKEAGAILR